MFKQTTLSREIYGLGNILLLEGNSSQPMEALAPYAGKAQCVYIDPPFMTGETFQRKRPWGEEGWKKGRPFVTLTGYEDKYASREVYLTMLRGMLEQAKTLLNDTGLLLLHLDWHASAYARILCDEIFGEKNFLNEIIWSYQSGGRSKRFYSRKHDNILMYAKAPDFRFDITRVPMERRDTRKNHMKQMIDEDGRTYRTIRTGGKTYKYYDDDPVYPGDVWTDVSHLQQRDPERTGLATQKPVKLLERLLMPIVDPGDLVVDLCNGSGTTAVAAQKLQCRYIGVDAQPAMLCMTAARLDGDYELRCSASALPASLDASRDGIEGMVLTLHGFRPQDARLPEPADSLELLEQWRVGRIVNDVLYVQESFTRTPQRPSLMPWMLLPGGDGEVGISVTDPTGERRIYRWEEA